MALKLGDQIETAERTGISPAPTATNMSFAAPAVVVQYMPADGDRKSMIEWPSRLTCAGSTPAAAKATAASAVALGSLPPYMPGKPPSGCCPRRQLTAFPAAAEAGGTAATGLNRPHDRMMTSNGAMR